MLNFVYEEAPERIRSATWNASLDPRHLTAEERELMRRMAEGHDEAERDRMILAARPEF